MEIEIFPDKLAKNNLAANFAGKIWEKIEIFVLKCDGIL